MVLPPDEIGSVPNFIEDPSNEKGRKSFFQKEVHRFYGDAMQSLSAFQRIASTLSQKFEVKEICDEVVKILSDELDLEYCSIMLIDDKGDSVVNLSGVSPHRASEGKDFYGRSFRMGEGVAGMVAKTNSPILISDVEKDRRFLKIASAVNIKSLLCLPICSSGKVLGVLNLSHTRKTFFSKHHEKVFSILSTIIGHLITFARLQKDLEGLNRDLQAKVMVRTREIEASHEYLKNIFENASDVIFTIDTEGRFTFLNKRIEDLGYSRDELVGKSFDSLLVSDEGIRVFVNVLNEGCKKTLEIDLKGKNAGVWHTLCSFSPLKSHQEGIVGMLGIAKDISERKMLEQKLFQTEKLTSLVTLVSGIAHELNNRLLPVLVYSELLQQSPLRENELKLVKTINRSAVGAKHIVESLLRFSRQEKPQKQSVDLNQGITDVLNIVRYRFTTGAIEVNLELDEGLPMTCVDERQMEQVFMNVINNACDALDHAGGRITIRSSFTADHISVEIMNNGPEIPPEDLHRIFDPFYTSKEVGKGTGLGLSLCYGIVHEHGGEISASSALGETVFTIKIPIVGEWEQVGLPASDPTGAPGKRLPKKKILIVDDEEDQLEVMKQILEKDFDVVVCGSGRRAIERLELEHYDLIISDLKMPEIDGVAIFQWVKEHHPEMARKILFSTGDVLGPKFEKVVQEVEHRYILKPYNIEELQNKVRKILEVS